MSIRGWTLACALGLGLFARTDDAACQQAAPKMTPLEKLLVSAELLAMQGKVPEAVAAEQQALTLAEKTFKPNDLRLATIANRLGELYEAEQDYADAEPTYKRVVDLREKVLGPKDAAYGAALNNLGDAYLHAGDYASAEPLFLRADAVLEQAGSEDRGVGAVCSNLGKLYHDTGDYAKAEIYQKRALAVREKVEGPEGFFVAVTLNDLAELYEDKGDYSAAEPLHERALAIRIKVAGPADVAQSQNNLAMLYEFTGDYARAEPLLQKALEVREQVLGPEAPEVSDTLNNLAMVAQDKGDYVRAEPKYARALAIREKFYGRDHDKTAEILNNLANLYREKGDYSQAEQLLQRCLSIDEKRLGSEHPKVALTLNNLASAYMQAGEPERAEPLLQRAIAIQEKALGPEHPLIALSLNNLAAADMDLDRYAQAEPLLQRALRIQEKGLGPTHPSVIGSLENLAVLHEALGDSARAVVESRRAGDARELSILRVLATGSERQKRALLAMYATEMDVAASLALATRDGDAAKVALTALLRQKGRVVDAMGSAIRAVRRKLDPDGKALLDELMTVRSELAAQTLPGRGAKSRQGDPAQLAKLAARQEEIEALISSKSDAFRVIEQPVTLDAVQAAIPKGAALVEWTEYMPFRADAKADQRWGARHVAAAVLTCSGPPAWVDLGEAAAIKADVAALRKALSTSDGDPKPAARAVEARAFAPVRALLGANRWVLLSPDGALNLVPFGALVDDDGHYLIERWRLSYLTSGRDLLRLGLRAGTPTAIVLMGAPTFGTVGKESDAADERGLRSVDLSTMIFDPLPGTKAEVFAIGSQWPAATVLMGDAATEGALKAAHGPRLLHVATHGFFLPVRRDAMPRGRGPVGASDDVALHVALPENPLLRSGLALAGANARRSGDDDGILTALEASSLDLEGTQLVTLSACETGLGEATRGDGVYGLRRSLVLAGAETQMMSLWKVDDAATLELMSEYYARLARGQGRAEALRQVQLSMLAKPERAHPYYWAAFLISGNPNALDGAPGTTDLAVHGRACGCRAVGGNDEAPIPPLLAYSLPLMLVCVRRARGRCA